MNKRFAAIGISVLISLGFPLGFPIEVCISLKPSSGVEQLKG